MMSQNRKLLRTAIAVLSLCAILLSGCSKQETSATLPAEEKLVYEGQEYEFRDDLTTVLVMGLDKYERPEEEEGYTNHLQSDFMLLLVIDEAAKKTEVLHLNRDTMTTIRRLGVGGGTAGKFQGQLALAHTYGSGGSDSCLNAVRAVSDLLLGVDIDHYMTLTMDSVGLINDAVGGVTVTVMDDLTSEDPALVEGEAVTLMGEQALTYVRTRKGLDDSSNLRRMERQQQYMKALYGTVMEKAERSEGFLTELVLETSEHFVSDCTPERIEQLAQMVESCEISAIRSLEGEAKMGDEYVEFYADQNNLLETVVSLLCKPVGN